jgi:hypothetical protein
MRPARFSVIAALLLAAACGKLGPPVRASHARAASAAAPAVSTGEVEASDARAPVGREPQEEDER